MVYPTKFTCPYCDIQVASDHLCPNSPKVSDWKKAGLVLVLIKGGHWRWCAENRALYSRAEEILLREEDLAAVLRVDLQYVRSLRYRNEGPEFARHGRKIWYRQADVQKWIDSCAVRLEYKPT